MKLSTRIAAFTAGTIGAAAITMPLMAQTADTTPKPVPARTATALPPAHAPIGPARKSQEQGRQIIAGETGQVTPPPRTALPKN